MSLTTSNAFVVNKSGVPFSANYEHRHHKKGCSKTDKALRARQNDAQANVDANSMSASAHGESWRASRERSHDFLGAAIALWAIRCCRAAIGIADTPLNAAIGECQYAAFAYG